ncbi:hypothetical protein PHMEG_00038886 [Phytophthora megakarya]|uniref:DDE-1 domain-containing protein n=1 Tax=Phytophthora megakarya TaxID=4795 RepID=A0A225UGM2_9STRA|nr:hypothetical protein PHMEG_00038886 [Phytophthora megakarya]
MPRRPKNKNKIKYRRACAVECERAVDVASRLKVSRSTIYRWRKSQVQLCSASASAPNKYFAPSLTPRKQYTRGLCVTTKCIVLMIGKFDAVFSAAKTNIALLSWDLYRRWHIDNPFASNASERRLLLSKMIGEAWEMITAETIIGVFQKAGHIPIGPRDMARRF